MFFEGQEIRKVHEALSSIPSTTKKKNKKKKQKELLITRTSSIRVSRQEITVLQRC
jgi:hypothetical protein